MIRSRARSVTAQEVEEFARLSGDMNPLHRAVPEPRRVVHGLLGMSMAMGVIEETGVHHGSTLAMVEL